MGLGRQVHDMGDRVTLDDFEGRGFVAQVHLFKGCTWDVSNTGKVFEAPRVREAIEVYEFGDLGAVNDVADEIGADENRRRR